MAKFIPNYSSPTRISQQWQAHLQAKEYIQDVTSAIAESIDSYNERAKAIEGAVVAGSAMVSNAIETMASEVSDTIAEAAIAQIQVARQNTAAIVGAIEQSTGSIVSSINAVGQTLDDRLNLLVDQQRIGNFLLEGILERLLIPDFQKERLHYLKQGFDYYHNARIDSSVMSDALLNLKKAEERGTSDYVVLHLIGMIYLYSKEHVDPQAAEDYFLRAGRYAAIEATPGARRVASLLTDDANQVCRLAADAFRLAGFACYLQQKLPDAIKHAQRAAELDPSHVLARFDAAKGRRRACEGSRAHP